MLDNEDALELLESTANLLRGMTLDPAIPAHAKEAMRSRIDHIETFLANHPLDDNQDWSE